jgi:hypothetical protein
VILLQQLSPRNLESDIGSPQYLIIRGSCIGGLLEMLSSSAMPCCPPSLHIIVTVPDPEGAVMRRDRERHTVNDVPSIT